MSDRSRSFSHLAPQALILGLVVLGPPSLSGQRPQLTPKEIRGRLDPVIREACGDRMIGTDTSVTWGPSPILYHSSKVREDRAIATMCRNDGMTGVADARWDHGVQREVSVRWTMGDSLLFQAGFRFDGQTIVARGGREWTHAVPTYRWAIADYGLEDQLIPLLREATRGVDTLVLYRPFPDKWDTLAVTVVRRGNGVLATLSDSAESTWLLISADGAILQITRSRFGDFERRPLELSSHSGEYAEFRRPLPVVPARPKP